MMAQGADMPAVLDCRAGAERTYELVGMREGIQDVRLCPVYCLAIAVLVLR